MPRFTEPLASLRTRRAVAVTAALAAPAGISGPQAEGAGVLSAAPPADVPGLPDPAARRGRPKKETA
jgi:hypothetical protein